MFNWDFFNFLEKIDDKIDYCMKFHYYIFIFRQRNKCIFSEYNLDLFFQWINLKKSRKIVAGQANKNSLKNDFRLIILMDTMKGEKISCWVNWLERRNVDNKILFILVFSLKYLEGSMWATKYFFCGPRNIFELL